MSRRTMFGQRTATAAPTGTREPVPPALPRAAAIRINLLPHREVARERRKREFLSMLGLVALAGAFFAPCTIAMVTVFDGYRNPPRRPDWSWFFY
jgi:hypothetical protein